ncbi:hypothetical protein, partial [Candidatus Ulvibacter alkanivorans]|uniref:hypothetical protein n=1 Tax=Candidatus Ulvibacter alkanivorans TaxID=2267620 RepID=UPI001B35362F
NKQIFQGVKFISIARGFVLQVQRDDVARNLLIKSDFRPAIINNEAAEPCKRKNDRENKVAKHLHVFSPFEIESAIISNYPE